MQKFDNYLRAAYPVIWVNTLEPHRCETELAKIAKNVHGTVAQRWDVTGGLHPVNDAEDSPVAPTKAISAAAGIEKTLTIMHNGHRFMGIDVIQAIQNAIPSLKANGSCLVIMAPDADKLPPELARHVVVWDFPLPTKEELCETVSRVAEDAEIKVVKNQVPLADAALGLTTSEAEDALALSVVEKHSLEPTVVAREKAGALLRQVKISMEHYPDRFTDLGGLDNLKKFTLSTAVSPLSLGCFLLGVPGAGKSSFARCLGNELGIPTLSMDFGKMMGSLVGQSEGAIREALKAVDAMGRVVLFVDEIDKGLAGASSSGQLDSGVKAGVAGTWLKWLSDREPGRAYVVATANNVKAIPPEYLRAERWDAMFYIDLPTRDEKNQIWNIWARRFTISGEPFINLPEDKDWTGAEIRSCCRIASMMNCSLKDASTYIVPVAKSMAESISEMREWAKGRCLSASIAIVEGKAQRKIISKE